MNYILLVQTIISTVKAIEVLMPDSPGKEKLDVALTTIQGILGDLTASLPAIEVFVSAVVTSLNKAGVFKKG